MSLRLFPGLSATIARAQPLSIQPTALRLFSNQVPSRTSCRTASPSTTLFFSASFRPNLLKFVPSAGSLPPIGTSSSTFTSSFLRRAFSSTPSRSIRQTYFPRGSGSGGGPNRGNSSWWRTMKRRIDGIPEMTVIYGLIGINVGVFLLWQYGISSWQRFRDPSTYQFLTQNFVLNEANIMAGRIWTLITASFSHSSGSHIFVNCLGLYFVAPAAASLVGSATFLALYLGGGIVASLTSLTWHRLRGDKWAGSEGASGAIYASLAFYGALFPRSTFLLFFVVPMPAWLMIGGIFAWDLVSAIGRPNSGTDSAGHVGGIMAGVAAAMMVRRGGLSQVWRGGPRWR